MSRGHQATVASRTVVTVVVSSQKSNKNRLSNTASLVWVVVVVVRWCVCVGGDGYRRNSSRDVIKVKQLGFSNYRPSNTASLFLVGLWWWWWCVCGVWCGVVCLVLPPLWGGNTLSGTLIWTPSFRPCSPTDCVWVKHNTDGQG